MKLLLAVDSVTTLNILLTEITARSWPVGTEARIVSVVEDGEVPLKTWQAEGYGVSGIRKEIRRRGEQITTAAINRLQAAGIPAEVSVMRGDPAFLIAFAARKWGADLILIRAHNRTDFRNWLLGSVAKSVVESAPCSVEIVRSVETGQPITNEGMRILLATDGSDASLTAARAITETDWPAGSEVKIVSVIDPIIYSLEEIGVLRDRQTERAHRAIGQAINLLSNTSLKLSGEVIAGNTARQLIERARSWNADRIVLGTRERGGLYRLLFGSISASVANQAHCSVRIIRPDISRDGEPSSRRSNRRSSRMPKMYTFERTLRLKNAA